MYCRCQAFVQVLDTEMLRLSAGVGAPIRACGRQFPSVADWRIVERA